ncbi:MAG: helix-turn-helix transcriptional regulator [Lachnospiraceae bacterium]|jgi:transcriptional regulator with XRE-family HTH domain|nr:helix-turn-helix transcriptional regulator [Lachnospiraceae bacterium]
MANTILEHVGGRIRLYRKHRGLSLEELSNLIHKSKASISKYELGQVAIDIVTLYDIAQALDITPFQLFDVSIPSADSKGASCGNTADTIGDLHLYHASHKKIYHSILRTYPDDGTGQTKATLFYRLEKDDDIERCYCIYHGNMYHHELLLSFILRNYHNSIENILLNFTIPIHRYEQLIGMLSGINAVTHAPVAYKALLSKTPRKADSELLSELTIPHVHYKEMERGNSLSIPLE